MPLFFLPALYFLLAVAISDGIKCVHLLDEELGIEKIGLIAREACEVAAETACDSTYRAAARTITETTGLSISHQSVWNIVQKLGQQRAEQVARHASLPDSAAA